MMSPSPPAAAAMRPRRIPTEHRAPSPRGSGRAAGLLLPALLLLGAAPGVDTQAVAVGASIEANSAYSTTLGVCHGIDAGTQKTISDYDGTANGGSFSVLVISTYYTGCSPGRSDAVEWGQIAAALRAEFPGQVAFLTSLKGSSDCASWGNTYLGDDPNVVSILDDSNNVLHYGLFNDNPQYVIVDKSMVLRERWESASLDVASVRTSVAAYLAEADPNQDCAGSWGSWGSCDQTCGGGTQARTYTVSTAATGTGAACVAAHGATESQNCNTAACPVDCAGSWGSWDSCSATCGGGTESRTYSVSTAASNGGTACAVGDGTSESQNCNTGVCPVDCVGSWGSWGSCSATCGGGTESRTYSVSTTAANGGNDCAVSDGSSESQACGTGACPVDCAGSWGSWGSCSATCEGGTVSRSYAVSTAASNGGNDCAASDGTSESQACGTAACPVDCAGSWGSWGSCSATCGGGTESRSYAVSTAASNGGTVCAVGDGSSESQACGTSACSGDCAGSWSACTDSCETVGQRTWTEAAAQRGQGAACPVAVACQSGDDSCPSVAQAEALGSCVVDVCDICGGTGHSCSQVATTTVISGAVSLSGFVEAMKGQNVPLGNVQLQQTVSIAITGLDGDPSEFRTDTGCLPCEVRNLQIRVAAATLANVTVSSVEITGLGRRLLSSSGHVRRLQSTDVTIVITCTDDISQVDAFDSAGSVSSSFVQAMTAVSSEEIMEASSSSLTLSAADVNSAVLTSADLQSVVAAEPEYETTILCNVRTELHVDFTSPAFVAQTLTHAGTAVSSNMIQHVPVLCAPTLGEQHHIETVATAAHGLANPRDLQFNPAHPNMLWIANNDTDDLTLIDMNVGVSSAMDLRDRAPFHYMERISSLAFDSRGFFATCQESRNTYNDLTVANDFMGPTLYDGSYSELVNSRAQPCDIDDDSTTCYFTHQDMLHETPVCMGIAHDPELVTPFGHVYWLFDGLNGTLNRFDFQEPHGPGSLDHSRASIRRFSDVTLTAVPGVPGHVMMDPYARVLYIADTGTGRVIRVDPDSGRFLRNARREFSIYSSMESTFEYSIYGCTSQDVFATGIDRPSGLHVDAEYVYVGEYGTGRVLVFEKATGRRVSHVDTGARGLFGLEMDGQDQLWYVDGPGNSVGKVVVDRACPASAGATDYAAMSAVTWPTFQCTSQVVVDTDADRERFHHEAFLNEHNVSGLMSLDYSSIEASECGSVSLDVLLMEGFLCHVCLPNPCSNGGQCVHYDGVYTFGGFSCDCDGTGFIGDICQAAQTTSYVAAELVLDFSIDSVATGAAREQFVSNFQADIAVLANVDSSQVIVDDIRAGSVVVEFRIVNDAAGSAAVSPAEALVNLHQTLERGARLDQLGVEVDSSVLSVTANVDESGEQLPTELVFSEPRPDPLTTVAAEEEIIGGVLAWAVAAGACFVCVVCTAIAYSCRAIGRRNSQTNISINPRLDKLDNIRSHSPPSPFPHDPEAPPLRLPAFISSRGMSVRGIVNSRVGVRGQKEYKVRYLEGGESWLPEHTVDAAHIEKYEARKAVRSVVAVNRLRPSSPPPCPAQGP